MTSSSFPAIVACSWPAATLRSRALTQILFGLSLASVALMEVNVAADGQVLWKYKPSQEIRAPMAVSSNGVVYLAVWDRIRAFDGQTGTEQWLSEPLRPDFHAGPVVGRSGTVYAITKGRNELVALSGADGTVLWRVDTEAPTVQASLALAPGGLVLVGASTTVRAYDELTGEPLWAFSDSDRRFAPISTSSGGQVIFADSNGAVSALSAHSGELMWMTPAPSFGGAILEAASYGLDGSVLVPSASFIRAFDPESGVRRWAASRASSSGEVGQLLVGEDGSILDGASRSVLDPHSSASRAYELQLPEVTLTAPPRALLAGGAALFWQDRILYSVHLASQAVLWKTNLTGFQELGEANDFKVGPAGSIYLASRSAIWAFQGSIPLARTPWPVAGGDAANSRYVPFAIEAPLIYADPADQAVEIGKSLVLQVEGLGREPLVYEWYRNGSKLDSETNALLRLETVVAEDNGARFQVVLRNASGSVTSRVAVVTAGYVVDAASQGPGTVSKSPDLPVYPPNTQVTFQATPDAGKRLFHWNSDTGLTSQSLSLTVVSNSSVTALFDAQPGDRWWTFHANGDLMGCPAVGADGTIYVTTVIRQYDVTDSAWRLSAVDPATGHEKWQVTERMRRDDVATYYGVGTPTIGLDGTLYWGIGKKVLALEPGHGRTKWERSLGVLVSSALALDDEGGIFLITDRVVALNLADGSERWRFTLPSRPYGGYHGGITLSYSGKLLVGEYLVHALDRSTGQQLWQFSFATWYQSMGYYTYPTPSLDGSVQVGTGYGGSFGPWPKGAVFFGLDEHDGRFLWRANLGGIYASPSTLGPDGSIYVGGSGGDVRALNGTTRAVGWARTLASCGEPESRDTWGPAMVASDGTVYHSSPIGELTALAAATGHTKWVFDTGLGAALPCGSAVPLALGSDGRVYFAFRTNLYAVVGTAPLATHGYPKFMGNARNTGSGLVDPPEPKILRDPDPQSGVVGGNVQFRMGGQGRWPLSYQWYRDDQKIAGAIGSELVLPSVNLADGGASFYVVLSNAFGATTSKWARLNVGLALTQRVVGLGRIQVTPELQVYPLGMEVQVTAEPDPGREFESWFGSLSGTANVQTFRMQSNTFVGCRFSLKPQDPIWTVDTKTDLRSIPAVDDDDTVVVGGAAFQFENESHQPYRVMALDGKSGVVLWQEELPTWIHSTPVLGDNGLTYLDLDDGGKLRAVRTRTGQVVWEVRFSTYLLMGIPPVIGPDGAVYVALGSGRLRCLDGMTGKTRWETITSASATSMFLGGNDRLYVRSSVFFVHDRMTGRLLDTYPTEGEGPGIIDAAEVIYGRGWGGYYGLQGLSGESVWRSTAMASETLGSPVALGVDGTLFCGAPSDLRALDAMSGSVRWIFSEGGSPQPALTADGSLYFTTDKLNALDASSGDRLWTFDARTILSPPAVGRSGEIYLGSASGKFYALRGTQGPAPSGWSQYLGNSKRQSRVTLSSGPYLSTYPGPTRDTIVLNWQDRTVPSALEFTTSPSFPSGWTRVPGTPVSANGRKQLVIPRPLVPTFFRLRTEE
jgi:outer membrane protein assembly factor BamB